MRRSMLILSEHRQPKDLSSLLPTRFTQLLFRHRSVRVSPLDATLMDLPTSVANKRLTVGLNPLDATLTKNTGVPPPRQTFFSLLPLPPVRRFRLSDAHPCGRSSLYLSLAGACEPAWTSSSAPPIR